MLPDTIAGYNVESYADGNKILDGEFKSPDLFILDHLMPSIQGLALCKYLRINPLTKNVPVIIISGDDDSVRRKAKIAGADIFLTKPLEIRELLAQVTNALSLQSQH